MVRYNFLKTLKIIIVLIVFTGIALIARAQNQKKVNSESFAGEWFPLQISKGGLGQGMNMDSNGNVKLITGAYVSMKYEIAGDSLRMIFPDGIKVSVKYELTDSTLITYQDTAKTVLTRTFGESGSGIVGRWVGPYGAKKQIMDFTKAKKAYLTVPMNVTLGEYGFNSDSLKIMGMVKNKFKWSFDSDTLILNDGKIYRNFKIKY